MSKPKSASFHDERFAWNRRSARWRDALLLAVSEGRTKLEYILPLFREDPDVLRAAAAGGCIEDEALMAALESVDLSKHILRYDMAQEGPGFEVWALAKRPKGSSKAGAGKAPTRSTSGKGASAGAQLFSPTTWTGSTKVAAFARSMTKSSEWREKGVDYNWEAPFRRLSRMPKELRNDPDFIGPLLFCHGLVALIFASASVRADPDILRAVFSESASDSASLGHRSMIACLDNVLEDEATGRSGPAVMRAGERRQFANERDITVDCLDRQERALPNGEREALTSLLLFSPETDELGVPPQPDIVAVRFRSRIKPSAKRPDWRIVASEVRSAFNNSLPWDSKLDLFESGDADGDDSDDW